MAAEVLLAEVDRQLNEQRARIDAFATRSGLMTASSAVLAGFFSYGKIAQPSLLIYAIWGVGLAAVIGVLVLTVGRLVPGLSPVQLQRSIDTVSTDDIVRAKLLTLEANQVAISRTGTTFAAQAVVTLFAIVMLILARTLQ